MNVIVFDLDDTLYNEIDFVKSGFREVAKHLNTAYSVPINESYKFMMEQLINVGRGRIFDDVLRKYSIYNRRNVRSCVLTYRLHKPEITLSKEADKCLKRFESFPLYIVTDGNKLVQENKIEALKLKNRVKFSFITHRYGIKNAKPSPYCFLKICTLEKVSPENIVYIGDNPNKDFIGIKPYGFNTIRILKGNYKNVVREDEFEADNRINSLSELKQKNGKLYIQH
ncbi:MAG: HAD family hydrolase [Alkaliphilus sp.]